MTGKNFAKELRDKRCALFQSSPKLNRMFIARLIYIQRFTILIPSFHGLRSERLGLWPTTWGRLTKKKTLAFLESRSAKASSTNHQ